MNDIVDVLVVGGGPAGLAVATEARALGAGSVVVAERERELGGIARHSAHLGYGLRDLHRVMSGPAYAARWVAMATTAGVDLMPSTTVISLADGPEGIEAELDRSGSLVTLTARSVVVATGTRERPRSARLIPGDRSAGVLTTGALQQLARAGRFSGRRAVVVGAEHVSFSAVLTLAHARCCTVAVVTAEDAHQTYAPLAWATTGVRRVPVLSDSTIVAIHGRDRVTGVSVRSTDGTERTLECDTVVFSGSWVPDHELVRRAGFEVETGTRAPWVDGGLRLDRPGWFAAGNLLHGAETADACALDGRHAAASVVRWLADPSPDRWPARGPAVVAEPPLQWVFPTRLRPGNPPPRGRVLVRLTGRPTGPLPPGAHIADPSANRHVTIRQGERELWHGRLRGAVGPNRTAWIPADWIDRIDTSPGAPPIGVSPSR